MGCIHSKEYYTELQVNFAKFLETNCIKSYERYVQLSVIEAAFAYYLKNNNLNYKNVGLYMSRLCIDEGFDLSPGRIDDYLDTRCVLGVSLERFRKA